MESLDWDTGKTVVLGVLDNGDTHVLNDGKCDAAGRLWAGKIRFVVGAYVPICVIKHSVI